MKRFIILGLILIACTGVAFAEVVKDTNTTTKDTNTITKTQGTTVFPKIQNPLNKDFSDLPSLINGIVDLALRLGTIIAVLALVWVGFKFIIAQGDPGEIAKAKQALQWVIIGIAILFGAKLITEIIKGTLSNFVDPTKIKINN
jgi:hypothetical protein